MNHVEARYLSEIYRILERREIVATGVLAEMFRVKPSSVVDVVERLRRKGLIERPTWGRMILTRKGFVAASKIIHNHRVLELYFRDRLDLPPEETCSQALLIDYMIGDPVIKKMCEKLSYPTSCIHGLEVRHLGCRRS